MFPEFPRDAELSDRQELWELPPQEQRSLTPGKAASARTYGGPGEKVGRAQETKPEHAMTAEIMANSVIPLHRAESTEVPSLMESQWGAGNGSQKLVQKG